MHAVHNAIENDPLSKAIQTGDFAGLDTPTVDENEGIVRAGLAAPIINALWRGANNYVVKFDRAAWKAVGYDICKEDAFSDLRAKNGDNRHGCSDSDGSLYMIAHWGGGPHADGTKNFRNVEGIDELADFNITRSNIIDGSIKNFDDGGFDHLPSQQDMFGRVKGAGTKENLFRGITQVWNLPFCIVAPNKVYGHDNLEQTLALYAGAECKKMKDKNGKDWPYGTK